jgi:hypothetical protein
MRPGGRLHLALDLRYFDLVMSQKKPPQPKTEAERQAERKAERLALQLRANLQRRKAQVRARREGEADETQGLPAADGGAKDAD